MLLPHQVLPFLLHPDADVRDHAATYFEHLETRSPIETADVLWQAIDRFGDSLNESGIKQRQRFLSALQSVKNTDQSVSRALGLLGSPQSDSDCDYSIRRILQHIPLDILENRLTEILSVAGDELQAKLQHRLSLRHLSAEELWRQFEELAHQADRAKDTRKFDFSAGERYREALCNHQPFAIAKAMAVLEDPRDRWWLETWCAEMLGDLRHAPAIDLLIEKMQIEDADYLNQAARDALGKMDAKIAVPKLEPAYANEDVYFRMAMADAFADIKHPLAEAALLRLLPGETDPQAIANLCTALCDLCTTDGLEELRQVVIADRYDATIADIKELLITVAKMTDYVPPELEAWKAEIIDPSYKRKRRNSFLSSFGMTEEMAEKFQESLDAFTTGKAKPAKALPDSLASPEITLPIRRESAKIGRNDPCPCGSGKKYKKCCGK